jgi:hypothetical protein
MKKLFSRLNQPVKNPVARFVVYGLGALLILGMFAPSVLWSAWMWCCS